MTSPTSISVVTVLQLAGHWCIMKVNEDKTQEFMFKAEKDEKITRLLAKTFAEKYHLSYEDNFLILKQPFLVLQPIGDSWSVATIFSSHLEEKSIFKSRSDASKAVHNLAQTQHLEYFPLLGECLAMQGLLLLFEFALLLF